MGVEGTGSFFCPWLIAIWLRFLPLRFNFSVLINNFCLHYTYTSFTSLQSGYSSFLNSLSTSYFSSLHHPLFLKGKLVLISWNERKIELQNKFHNRFTYYAILCEEKYFFTQISRYDVIKK